MSIGYCAYCCKVLEDEQIILYEYTCYDAGRIGWEKAKETYDGQIMIEKDAFVEPTIHQKVKKMPGGRKKFVTKRIRNEVNYPNLLVEGKIKIKNCSSTWRTDSGVDIMAWKLLWKIFDEYQDTGVVPETIAYCS